MATLASMQSTVQKLCSAIKALQPPINPRWRPPASEVEIAWAEKTLELTFPPDLKYFLSSHDGQEFYDSAKGYGDPLVPMMRQPMNGQCYSHYWLLGVQDIVQHTLNYRGEHQWAEEEQFETVGPVCYHDRFLIFTATENADCLVLDLLPAPGGHVGQVVLLSTQPCELIVLAPNLETFLQSLAAGFRADRFKHNRCEHFVSYIEAERSFAESATYKTATG